MRRWAPASLALLLAACSLLSQYRAGMLGDNVPLSVDDFVRDAIASSTSARNAWDQTKIGYTKAYVTFVEEILDE